MSPLLSFKISSSDQVQANAILNKGKELAEALQVWNVGILKRKEVFQKEWTTNEKSALKY